MANLSSVILFLLLLLLQNPSPTSAYVFPLYHQNHPLITKHLGLDQNQAQPINGNISNIHGVYCTFFNVGLDPTSQVLLVFDTGSALTWIQAGNCSSCMPGGSTYTFSSTLAPLSCNDGFEEPRLCIVDNIPGAECREEHCWYDIRYGDGSTSVGVIAYDMIGQVFEEYNPLPSYRILLGLGYINWCFQNSTSCFDGIAGFGGQGYMTIPSQLKVKKWAFCLPLQDNDVGFITLNDSLRFKGAFNAAPLYFDLDFSIVYLSSVVVHGQDILEPGDKISVVLDTGSFLGYLESQLLERLLASVEYTIAVDYGVTPIESPEPDSWPLCYSMQCLSSRC